MFQVQIYMKVIGINTLDIIKSAAFKSNSFCIKLMLRLYFYFYLLCMRTATALDKRNGLGVCWSYTVKCRC